MRLIFYIFLISQLLNFFDVFAQKEKEKSSQLSSVKWERVEEKSKSLKEIIWKSYNDDESFYEDKNLENTFKKNLIETKEKKKQFAHNQKTNQALLQIQPHIPLNNFLDNGDFIFST